MESDAITWKIVPNTVANRMKNLSLIHKLTPTRRLCRRSKAMNIAIKQSRDLKTYNDDYSIFYKSDKSLTDYRTRMSKESKRDYEINFESDENDIVLNGTNEKTLEDSRSKSSKNAKVQRN
ncbi:hypothetical protein ANTQUA_LOCUS5169 [Anthophora quadrimaculata]